MGINYKVVWGNFQRELNVKLHNACNVAKWSPRECLFECLGVLDAVLTEYKNIIESPSTVHALDVNKRSYSIFKSRISRKKSNLLLEFAEYVNANPCGAHLSVSEFCNNCDKEQKMFGYRDLDVVRHAVPKLLKYLLYAKALKLIPQHNRRLVFVVEDLAYFNLVIKELTCKYMGKSTESK